METTKLKKFAQFARRNLLEQVSAKLKLVLAENSAARRENAEAIKKLEEAIKEHGKEQVIEKVAYIWFNRFCALRFMDVNRYTRIGIVSPAEGQFQPEILLEPQRLVDELGQCEFSLASPPVQRQHGEAPLAPMALALPGARPVAKVDRCGGHTKSLGSRSAGTPVAMTIACLIGPPSAPVISVFLLSR